MGWKDAFPKENRYFETENGILYNAEVLETLKNFPPESMNLILTDPPYGVLPNGKPNDKFKWDNIDLVGFTNSWFNLVKQLLGANSFMFTFWSQKYFNKGVNIFNPQRIIFWHYKNLTLGGNGDFAYDYEPIFVMKKGKAKLISGKHSCVLEYTKPQSNFKNDKLVHPAQKPLKLIKQLVMISSAENDLVLDCFAGSGTTLVACEELNRRWIGIELNEEYCEIAKRRIMSVTKQEVN